MKVRDIRDLADWNLMLANALRHADQRIDMISSFWQEHNDEKLPDEIKSALKHEIECLDALVHVTIGALLEGFISYEALLLEVSKRYGTAGAAKLEQFMQNHTSCWEALRKHGFEEWTPKKAKAASEKRESAEAERFVIAKKVVAKLLDMPPEEIDDAQEVVQSVNAADLETLRNAFGLALGYLVQACKRSEPELTALIGDVAHGAIGVVLTRYFLTKGNELAAQWKGKQS